VKADLQRKLETWSLNCTKCALDPHWVGGLGVTPGRRHAEPAQHDERPFEAVRASAAALGPHGPGRRMSMMGVLICLRLHWALASAVNCRVVSAIRLRSFVGVGREAYIDYGA
jgi:hypothetical protein